MAENARIITFRISQENKQVFVIAEYGIETLKKEIPKDMALVRVAAILDESGTLSALEIVTTKA